MPAMALSSYQTFASRSCRSCASRAAGEEAVMVSSKLGDWLDEPEVEGVVDEPLDFQSQSLSTTQAPPAA